MLLPGSTDDQQFLLMRSRVKPGGPRQVRLLCFRYALSGTGLRDAAVGCAAIWGQGTRMQR
eukprot:2218602-Rhodomonas_salina.3